jgi:type I restriction enzyme M protein
MLDSATRTKIDALRDTLVGKLPVPTEQVKQITLGLMYKFMGDLDEEYAKLGSKPFFAGKYEQYAWQNIMALTEATKRAELYAAGLEKMSLNPGIPQLFRDIFKGAFLPFRDPRIIGEFLKGIDEFEYEHSEDLGDAFEYLLQVSGEQGKAGQLRTPRHIIDFIVECVDPQKTDRILDPACGTAGFLISAYKHILRENTRPGSDRPGSALTTTERNALRDNFTGYDISHDMVRLSLVNLYLHLFPNPRIYEYDTLTSEERWREDADCILANPPFMTPKGGIRPHSRFQIKARRSEILFVDYMLEHLSPNGKMGVIVPEGVIFQSNTAYKALRKMLIDGGYLYAVVSLPGGVFNPYSGVKTSVLLIDRVLARKAPDILFVKVENDGFDLGAQRREVEGSDLPQALKVIRTYRKTLAEGEDAHEALQQLSRGVMLSEAKHLSIVSKAKIVEAGDYSLSSERHAELVEFRHQKWPVVELSSLSERITKGTTPTTVGYRFQASGVHFVKIESITEDGNFIKQKLAFISEECHEEFKRSQLKDRDVLFSIAGAFGRVAVVDSDILPANTNQALAIIRLREGGSAYPKYIFHILKSDYVSRQTARMVSGVAQYNLSLGQVGSLRIPLPPLSAQQEIVAELDRYQKVVDGARQVVENYRPQIAVDPDWKMISMQECAEINARTVDPAAEYGERNFTYIDITSVENGTGSISFANKVRGTEAPSRARRGVLKGDVLLSTVRPNLKAFAFLSTIPDDCIASTGFAVLTPSPKVMGHYLYFVLLDNIVMEQMLNRMGKGAYPSINQNDVENLKIPVPPMSIQRQIVARIEEEQQLVQANRRLIELFEAKIRDRIKRVWGE